MFVLNPDEPYIRSRDSEADGPPRDFGSVYNKTSGLASFGVYMNGGSCSAYMRWNVETASKCGFPECGILGLTRLGMFVKTANICSRGLEVVPLESCDSGDYIGTTLVLVARVKRKLERMVRKSWVDWRVSATNLWNMIQKAWQ